MHEVSPSAQQFESKRLNANLKFLYFKCEKGRKIQIGVFGLDKTISPTLVILS